ncbi:MAG: EF-hand domain-containing protein [Pelagibacteraceae bacterium]|jgi:Ca2+-binding EF-hand superfamily protein
MKKIFPVIIMLFASSSFAVADKHEAKFITKKEFIERNLKQLEQRFDQIDTNKDGKMTAEEEKAFVAKVKKARAERQALLKLMDENKDGKITPEEEKKLLMAMDSNKDGEVTPAEQKAYRDKIAKKK